MTAEPSKKPLNKGGRPKGALNKRTVEFRETVQRVLDDNAINVGKWLTAVAEGDAVNEVKPDPAKALDLLAKLAEYAAPKLNRTEHTGKDGGPIDQNLSVTFVGQ